MGTAISTAVGTERLSRVSGYQILKGFFGNLTPNLPQQIAILAEANDANQGALPLAPDGVSPVGTEITSAAQAAAIYGYGSPIHQIMRILRPVSGNGVGGIPTVVFAQLAADDATPTEIVWEITGAPTANVTHYIIVNGRESLDGQMYEVNILATDTTTEIAQKYADAMNSVLGCPFIAVASTVHGINMVTFTTKWSGLTSADATIGIDVNGNAAGIVYALTTTTPGTGTPDISGALNQFENTWFTSVVNSYGGAQFDELEEFNGVPDPVNPTGRYNPISFMPFIAFSGNCDPVAADLIAITNAAARINQCTNSVNVAPGSAGMPYEAAANVVALFAPTMQNTPEIDISGMSYPDMPVPPSETIGDLSDYNNRDLLMKNGCSTVTLEGGAYVVQDLVTTYHTVGESPWQFNYPRNLNLDWNIADGYNILNGLYVKDKVIIADNQPTTSNNAIKPSEWKSVLYNYFDELANIGLLNNPAFSKAGLQVQIDPNNGNRINTAFPYQRTGTARIQSTTATGGFNASSN